MPRTRHALRRRVFVGAEGNSEQSLAKWLQMLCEREDLHVYLDIRVCKGGDTFSVTNRAVKEFCRRKSRYGEFDAGFVLLDSDRLKQDISAGRDPRSLLRCLPLRLVWQKPKIEGLFLRLHPGQERKHHEAPAHDVDRLLQSKWKDYAKPASANALDRHFTIHDLQRAARYDTGLREVIEILRLPLPHED